MPQVRQRLLPDPGPIVCELLLRWSNGFGQELQDVLSGDAQFWSAGDGRRQPRRLDLAHRKIIAKALEHGFAKQAIIRQRSILDLDLERRLDPGRLRLFDRRIERRTL